MKYRTKIGATSGDGFFRMAVEVAIPDAPNGQWSPRRIKRLVEKIESEIDLLKECDATDAENARRPNNSERESREQKQAPSKART